jgi:hypothetical protein
VSSRSEGAANARPRVPRPLRKGEVFDRARGRDIIRSRLGRTEGGHRGELLGGMDMKRSWYELAMLMIESGRTDLPATGTGMPGAADQLANRDSRRFVPLAMGRNDRDSGPGSSTQERPHPATGPMRRRCKDGSRPLGPTSTPGSARKQVDDHGVEFFEVQVLLDVDFLFAQGGLVAFRPDQGVTVTGGVGNVDV